MAPHIRRPRPVSSSPKTELLPIVIAVTARTSQSCHVRVMDGKGPKFAPLCPSCGRSMSLTRTIPAAPGFVSCKPSAACLRGMGYGGEGRNTWVLTGGAVATGGSGQEKGQLNYGVSRPMSFAPTSRPRRQITRYVPSGRGRRRTGAGRIRRECRIEGVDPHPAVGNIGDEAVARRIASSGPKSSPDVRAGNAALRVFPWP